MSTDAQRPLFLSAVDWLSRATGVVSAALLLAMLLIISYDVFLRYGFNSPTVWATEISTYVLVALAFLGTGYTQKEDGHIRVEILFSYLPEPRRVRLALVAAWTGLPFLAVATWQAVVMIHDNYVNATRIFSLLYTLIYIPQIPIAVGLFVFTLAVLAEAYRLSAPLARWREWTVIGLLVGVLVGLWVLGARPPAALGSRFDWGSVLIALGCLTAVWLWSGSRIVGWVLLIYAAAATAFVLARGLAVGASVGVLIAVTLLLLGLGIRIAIALGLVGLIGIYFLLPAPAPVTVAERSWDTLNTFTLTAVPMFVLMGGLLLRSGLTEMTFDVLLKWMGRFPGGIAHAGVVACSIFAAVSGSSVATAATVGVVACPEMIKRGYSPRLAYGSIAAGGTLGILIPPSIPFIIYGSTVGTPIATLFIAGIVPGLILTVGFMGAIFVWALFNAEAAPPGEWAPWGEKLTSLVGIVPVALLILAVLGTLYAGIATPSEAGAMGALAALLICLVRRRLGFGELLAVLLETVKVTSFLFVIIVGASILSYIFDYLRLPSLLVEAVKAAQLDRWMVMVAIWVIYIILGMFIDSISIMVMTLPVLFPLVVTLGFDPVWFGVVLVILLEIGLITPPVGMNLFVLRGISGSVALKEIVYGTIPFFVVMLVGLVLLYLVPGLATWLPGSMK